jgi:hypothetical protein
MRSTIASRTSGGRLKKLEVNPRGVDLRIFCWNSGRRPCAEHNEIVWSELLWRLFFSVGCGRSRSSRQAGGLGWAAESLLHPCASISLPATSSTMFIVRPRSDYRVGTLREVRRHARFHHHNNTITIYFHTRQLHQYEPNLRCD